MGKNLLVSDKQVEINFLKNYGDLLYLNLSPEEMDRCRNSPTSFDHLSEDIDLDVIKMIRDPNFFYFTCKEILNVDLLPIQVVILQEMWYHPFPMLIAGRGSGKCVNGNTRIITDSGFRKMKDFISENSMPNIKYKSNSVKLLGENKFSDVEYFWNNGKSKTIKIKTNGGFNLETSPNHPIRVYRGSDLLWVESQDIKLGDIIPIDRTPKWFPNTNDLPKDLAYAFGLLIGYGDYTVRGHISFTTNDIELSKKLSKISMKYFNKPFNKQSSKYQYLLCGVKIWDDLFFKYGFNSTVCGEKDFPSSVLSADKDTVAFFIKGLYDTNGSISKNGTIKYSSESKNLVETLQFVLLRFGIITRIKKQFNKKYHKYYYKLLMTGEDIRLFSKFIGFGLKRKQKILNTFLNKKNNPNLDVIPKEIGLSHLLQVRELYRKNIGFSHDPTLSIYKFKKYDLTYNKLKDVLELTKDFQDDSSWQFLNNLYNNHFYFDRVKSLEEGFDYTYDLHLKDDHSFITNGFISHNSFLLGVYASLFSLIHQGCKVAITGAVFRQSKVIFEYIESIWNNAPVLRDLLGNNPKDGPKRDIDRWSFRIGESLITAYPIGIAGQNIRGQRARLLISDEFSSMIPDIYEIVISGFAAVSASPVENVKSRAKVNHLKQQGLWTQAQDENFIASQQGNQSIISGTSYYAFNHFYRYFQQYKNIIQSKGDIKKIEDIFGEDAPPGTWKDYAIIRIPIELIPPGFMSDKDITRARANSHIANYMMEFGTIFAKDSAGFFKRTLIETCVTSNEVEKLEGIIKFRAMVKGNPGMQYVYGIDPASEKDNFSIVVLELHEDHARVVYCWTTTKERHRKKLNSKITVEETFYGYCARKIRDLMRVFPCSHISMDSQGGGYSVMEALHDEKRLKPGEVSIWSILPNHPLSDKKERDTDNELGLHIVELVQFANAQYTSDANHGLRKDLETQEVLFPIFDPLELEFASCIDTQEDRVSDTLEDCVLEIEELKEELSTITHTQTNSGRDKWDTPEIKLDHNRKGRMRKDRYSALLMANAAARRMSRVRSIKEYGAVGGFVGLIKNPDKDNNKSLYVGSPVLVQKINAAAAGYGFIAQKHSDENPIIRRGGQRDYY